MIFVSKPSSLIKQLLLQIQQINIIKDSTDPSAIPLLPYPQGMTTPKTPLPPKQIKMPFFPDKKKFKRKVFPKIVSLFLILLLVKALYENHPKESLFVPFLESKTSHQPIKFPQTAPINLKLVPLILSLASEFENLPQISQTFSLTLPQFKHLPTGAQCREYQNHPNLPNVYVPK
ncbi:hypothetical protein O181_095896 [Austropuccinia psidii MF-1]|uniref:Uncharacterized protein n=1 Tax=Austropuccinia psidii MF-1 TaxID=1389203 RepID=A0A9Q3J622_9BASI|nr:hypothetical protein [Austropuccinia psidii MF-1]